MIGKIGDFKIEIASSIVHNINQSWSKMDRINNNPLYVKNSKWNESIELSGTLVLEKNDTLNGLKELIKQAKPVSLVIADEVYDMVIIQSINFTKSIFNKTGQHIKEDFSVSVKRYFN